MQNPLVSVIIPNYNYAKYLREAVDSVLNQTYQNVEVIVVDDGSKDNSREILESYGDRINFILQRNQGVSAARNNGVSQSSGEFAAFLDADDVWLPDKLEKQIVKFANNPKVGFVHSAMTIINSEGEAIGMDNDGMDGAVGQKLLEFEKGVVVLPASSGVVRRTVFDEIGGFDERLSTAADWDFCYRLTTRYDLAFVPENLVLYRVHGSNMHGNIKVMEHDMMIGYEKAFASGATANRRKCYGNLHRTLAGSYFYAGQYGSFAWQTFLSLWNRPANIGYFAGFPLRRWRRR